MKREGAGSEGVGGEREGQWGQRLADNATEAGGRGQRPHWRFEDLEIWRLATDLAVEFHRVAMRLEERRLYRYAEQFRAARLSVSNNIGEGSASPHSAEFRQFLNIARRSLFEDVSMVLVLERLGLLETTEVNGLLALCDMLSRKITTLTRTLD